jgi:hypothetical protein
MPLKNVKSLAFWSVEFRKTAPSSQGMRPKRMLGHCISTIFVWPVVSVTGSNLVAVAGPKSSARQPAFNSAAKPDNQKLRSRVRFAAAEMT